MPTALVTADFPLFSVVIDARDKTAGIASFAKINATKGAYDLTFF
jgi:hypothetical protein